MADDREFKSPTALMRALARDMQRIATRSQKAALRAAKRGVSAVKAEVPVAHGELRESVHSEGMRIVVDAPHAAAVNNGSRPHMPPLAPLIEWVKLRGMQGLGTDRQLQNSPGNTTASAARGVAGMLAKHARGGVSDIDAPRKVAMAIAIAISKRGTKAHHFIERAMPEIRAILREEMVGIRRTKPTASDDTPLKLNGQIGRSYHYGKKGGIYYVSHTGRRTYVKSHKVRDVLDEGHHIHAYKKGSL